MQIQHEAGEAYMSFLNHAAILDDAGINNLAKGAKLTVNQIQTAKGELLSIPLSHTGARRIIAQRGAKTAKETIGKKIEKKGFKAKINIENGIDELISVFNNTQDNIINNY